MVWRGDCRVRITQQATEQYISDLKRVQDDPGCNLQDDGRSVDNGEPGWGQKHAWAVLQGFGIRR